jgi:hypothetical protein
MWSVISEDKREAQHTHLCTWRRTAGDASLAEALYQSVQADIFGRERGRLGRVGLKKSFMRHKRTGQPPLDMSMVAALARP